MYKSINIYYLYVIFFFTFWVTGIHAQQYSGFVFEIANGQARTPLTGVNVYWSGTTHGTFTDAEGNFRIQRHSAGEHLLVVSLLGYQTDTIDVSKQGRKIDVELKSGNLQLSEVEISGKMNDSYISRMKAQQTQVITSGELKRAACCNLAESFETNASVDVSYSDAVSGARQIQLLGLSGIYSQVMTENVPLIRGLATPFGLSYIPGPWMESIQVAKGSSSVVQGYESITGQINVEYKKPETTEKFFINLFGNSNLRLEANADGAVKINERLSTSLLVHAADFRHEFDRNCDGFMDIPKVTTLTAMNRWDYSIPNKWISRFGIKYLYEERNGGQMGFSEKNFTFDTTGISTGVKPYGIGVTTNRLETFWKNGVFLGPEGHASIGLILSAINHLQDGYYGINTYHGHEQNFNANLLFTWHDHEERNKVSAGTSFMVDNFEENFLQTRLAYRYQYLPDSITPTEADLFTLVGDSLVTYLMDRSEMVIGGFLEYTYDIRNKFSIIAGIRADYSSLYGFFLTPRLHLRVSPIENLTIRGSVGRGTRSPNLLAENSAVFVSQRALVFADDLSNESAWNYGLNITWDFKMFGHKAELSVDGYRTVFQKQVVVDQDSLPVAVFFYNLDGKSFANVLQAQLMFAPLHRLLVTAAFRVNDVKTTEGNELKRKAMVNAYKGLLTISYATKFDRWKFDLTGQLNGPARLPDTDKMPASLQIPGSSPAWFNLLAQVTRKFKKWELYLGGENLTGYRQLQPIIEPEKPYHTHFDGSIVWGPVTGITIYAGLRFKID